VSHVVEYRFQEILKAANLKLLEYYFLSG